MRPAPALAPTSGSVITARLRDRSTGGLSYLRQDTCTATELLDILARLNQAEPLMQLAVPAVLKWRNRYKCKCSLILKLDKRYLRRLNPHFAAFRLVWSGMVWCPSYPLDRNRCDQVVAAGSGAG
jgi:hypothetical protein